MPIFQLPVQDLPEMSAVPGFPGAKSGTCTVRCADLPKALLGFTELNPRRPVKSAIYNSIVATLEHEPIRMVIRNRGVKIVCENVGLGEDDLVHLKLTSRESHGVADGGHTLAAIMNSQDEGVDLSKAFVKVELFVGLTKSQACEISHCQNTSKQVQPHSLLHAEGKFDEIEKIMRGKPGFEQIAYHEGHPGRFNMATMVQIINAFNCEMYSPIDNNPKTAQPNEYGRARKSYRLYEEHYDKRPSSTKLVITALPDILRTYDHICARVRDAWNLTGSRYGNVLINLRSANDFHSRLYFTGTLIADHKTATLFDAAKTITKPRELPYGVTWGMISPILAAYRANVNWDLAAGKFAWYKPIDDVFAETIDDVVAKFVGVYTSLPAVEGSKFNLTTKDKPQTYQVCYDAVVNYLLRHGVMLPKLKKSAA